MRDPKLAHILVDIMVMDMMPSDHFKIGPKFISQLLFELQGLMCCPGETLESVSLGTVACFLTGNVRICQFMHSIFMYFEDI